MSASIKNRNKESDDCLLENALRKRAIMQYMRENNMGPYEIAEQCGINAIKMTDWLCDGHPLDRAEIERVHKYCNLIK